MQFSLIAARALHFWAVATLLGGAGLALALRRGGRPVSRTLRRAAAMAAASGVAWFAIVFVTVTNDVAALVDPESWSAFLSAPFGVPWLLRLGLCGLAVGVAVAGCEPVISLTLGIAFVIDQAWLGHAATGVGLAGAIQIGLYWLHVFCGFAWVGALVMLGVLSVSERRIPSDGLALFSNVGILVVGAILGSGLLNASLRGVDMGDLASTPYGRLLAVKMSLFLAMLVLAIFNRSLRHKLDNGWVLRVSIASEVFLGLVILGVAAVLGVTAPP